MDEDLADNAISLSQLIQAIGSHLHFNDPMNAADCVTMDDDILVADNDMDGYKVRLLADLRRTDNFTSSCHSKDQYSQDDEAEEVQEKTLQCESENVTQAMQYIKELKLSCLKRDYGPVLNSLAKTQFILQDFSWKSEAEAKQSTLDSFFCKIKE